MDNWYLKNKNKFPGVSFFFNLYIDDGFFEECTFIFISKCFWHWSRSFALKKIYLQNVIFVFISDGDPDNFLSHFQRATVFMALGRSKSALPDLDRVLELKPEFLQVSNIAIFMYFYFKKVVSEWWWTTSDCKELRVFDNDYLCLSMSEHNFTAHYQPHLMKKILLLIYVKHSRRTLTYMCIFYA